MSAGLDQANDDGVQGQEVTNGPVILDYDVQRRVPFVVHSVDVSATVQEELGDQCIGEAADVVGVEVVHRRARVDSVVQQARAVSRPGIQVDQVVNLLVDPRLLLIPALRLGGDAHQIQEGEDVAFVVVHGCVELSILRAFDSGHPLLYLQDAAPQDALNILGFHWLVQVYHLREDLSKPEEVLVGIPIAFLPQAQGVKPELDALLKLHVICVNSTAVNDGVRDIDVVGAKNSFSDDEALHVESVPVLPNGFQLLRSPALCPAAIGFYLRQDLLLYNVLAISSACASSSSTTSALQLSAATFRGVIPWPFTIMADFHFTNSRTISSLLGLHTVVLQEQAHNFGVSIAGSNDERCRPLPTLVGDVAQQIADVALRAVQEQGCQGQHPPLAGRLVDVARQALHGCLLLPGPPTPAANLPSRRQGQAGIFLLRLLRLRGSAVGRCMRADPRGVKGGTGASRRPAVPRHHRTRFRPAVPPPSVCLWEPQAPCSLGVGAGSADPSCSKGTLAVGLCLGPHAQQFQARLEPAAPASGGGRPRKPKPKPGERGRRRPRGANSLSRAPRKASAKCPGSWTGGLTVRRRLPGRLAKRRSWRRRRMAAGEGAQAATGRRRCPSRPPDRLSLPSFPPSFPEPRLPEAEMDMAGPPGIGAGLGNLRPEEKCSVAKKGRRQIAGLRGRKKEGGRDGGGEREEGERKPRGWLWPFSPLFFEPRFRKGQPELDCFHISARRIPVLVLVLGRKTNKVPKGPPLEPRCVCPSGRF
uniref:uncharacterized protein LOC114584672 n=1 Tax=Podarcis muralis TaxID=64176 RepID=UPI00109F0008|nr:uncharacterized protein LOC114584672 [Podarcis muralis]